MKYAGLAGHEFIFKYRLRNADSYLNVLWNPRNGHIVEVGDLLLSDSRLRVLTPVTVDAVEVSVLVFLGEDSVKL